MLSRNKHQKAPQPPLSELPLAVGDFVNVQRNVLVDAVRIATNLPLCFPVRHPSFAIIFFLIYEHVCLFLYRNNRG